MVRNHFLVDSPDTCSQTAAAVVLQVDILVPHALAPSRPSLARREGDRGSLFTATQSATPCSFGICVYWRSASRMGYFGPSPLECYLWSACLPETIVPRPTNLIVLIGIRLGASLPVRPDRRASIELVVFCSLTLSKYFSPGLQPLSSFLLLRRVE